MGMQWADMFFSMHALPQVALAEETVDGNMRAHFDDVTLVGTQTTIMLVV